MPVLAVHVEDQVRRHARFDRAAQQQTCEEDAIDELSNLKAKAIRKYKIQDIQNIEPKTKAKLLNYLKYRGFNAFEVLEKWQKEDE